jgi:uncharacterized membrane protein YgaE (UPF0421/DUF939 family)
MLESKFSSPDLPDSILTKLCRIGLTFIGVMIGIFCAMLLLPLQEKAYRKVCEERGVVPEARLPLMMFGSM